MFENFEKLFSTHWVCHIVRTILSILRDGAPSIIICLQTDPPEQRWVWINYQNYALSFFCQADETLTSPGADKSEVEDIVSKPSHQSSMLFFHPSPLSPWYWLSWLATILLDSSLKALTQKNWAFLLYPNIWIEGNGFVNYFILIWSKKKTSVGWYGSEQEVITVASNNSKSNCYFLPQLRPRTLDNFNQFSKYISLIYSRCLCSSRRHVVKVGYDWDHFSYLWRIPPKKQIVSGLEIIWN